MEAMTVALAVLVAVAAFVSNLTLLRQVLTKGIPAKGEKKSLDRTGRDLISRLYAARVENASGCKKMFGKEQMGQKCI